VQCEWLLQPVNFDSHCDIDLGYVGIPPTPAPSDDPRYPDAVLARPTVSASPTNSPQAPSPPPFVDMANTTHETGFWSRFMAQKENNLVNLPFSRGHYADLRKIEEARLRTRKRKEQGLFVPPPKPPPLLDRYKGQSHMYYTPKVSQVLDGSTIPRVKKRILFEDPLPLEPPEASSNTTMKKTKPNAYANIRSLLTRNKREEYIPGEDLNYGNGPVTEAINAINDLADSLQESATALVNRFSSFSKTDNKVKKEAKSRHPKLAKEGKYKDDSGES
jgi:hypothetical protein